jgi:response regulator NasT
MQTSALVVGEDARRSQLLKQSVEDCGYAVVALSAGAAELVKIVETHQPDVLVLDRDAPDQPLLSALRDLTRRCPRPVVLFTRENDRDIIARAVQAGVSAYIANCIDPTRIGSILDVAIARFRETDRLHRELHDTRVSLAERKAVERAKGILMQQRGCNEPEAYHALRKMAMDRNLRIGQVAENVITVAELLN